MARRPALALVVVALIGLGVDLRGDSDTESSGAGNGNGNDGERTLTGYTRDPTPSVAGVELQLADGSATISPTASAGGLRIVYFGFTSCPDVCPTTMSDLRRAIAGLDPDEQDRIEVAMVTIDPDRDVAEKLDAYITTFVPDGDAVRFADPEELAAVAAAFGAQYRVAPGEGDRADPEVSHSADLYAVDDRGDLVLQWPFGVTWEDLRDDLRALLSEIDRSDDGPDDDLDNNLDNNEEST